jgi:hypothetical protein
MRPPHDIVFKYTHQETARLIIANCTLRIGRPIEIAGRLSPLRSNHNRIWRGVCSLVSEEKLPRSVRPANLLTAAGQTASFQRGATRAAGPVYR